MIIFNAHLDLAWNAIDWNRDLLQPVSEIRAREQAGSDVDLKAQRPQYRHVSRTAQGESGHLHRHVVARLFRPNLMPAIQRYAAMQPPAPVGQMAYYRTLERQGHLHGSKDWPTLEKHANAWIKNETGNEPLGFILSMEGADPFSRRKVGRWHKAGFAIIGPAHYGVSPSHGTGTEGGSSRPASRC